MVIRADSAPGQGLFMVQVMLLGFASFGFLILVSSLYWRFRGRRVMGTVVSSYGVRTRKTGTRYGAVYRYIDALGRTLEARGNRLTGRPPENGTTAMLLSMAAWPDRVREVDSFRSEAAGVIFCAFPLAMLYTVTPWPLRRLLCLAGVLTLAYAAYAAHAARRTPAAGSPASLLADESCPSPSTSTAPTGAGSGIRVLPAVDANAWVKRLWTRSAGEAQPRGTKWALWVVPLFVLDLGLVISPPPHKTGAAAFGGSLFVLACLLGCVALAWQVLALLFAGARRVAHAVRTTSELAQVSSSDATLQGITMAPEHTASPSRHAGRRGLWIAVLALFAVSGGLLATGFLQARVVRSPTRYTAPNLTGSNTNPFRLIAPSMLQGLGMGPLPLKTVNLARSTSIRSISP